MLSSYSYSFDECGLVLAEPLQVVTLKTTSDWHFATTLKASSKREWLSCHKPSKTKQFS